jgi:glucose-6-phosphate dehydrogenase assembly protein OpcA
MEERVSAAAVHPESILRDLNELWAQLAEDSAATGGVLRACAMTLVVAAESQADAGQARRTVGLLMKDYPSRAVLVYPGGSAELEARVFAECWKPFGRAQQICAEGIEIAAGAGGYAEAARFLIPLRAPDLPSVLWCRGAAALTGGRCAPLYPLASKIVFDTRETPRPDEAFRALRHLHAHGYRVADLHWARLTGWREALAHLFDGGLRADQVREARVRYGGPRATTCARYFDAWLRTALPQARVLIQSAPGDPGLDAVMLLTPEGELTVRRAGLGQIEIEGHGLHYRSALPPVTEDALMREELAIAGHDPIYERVLHA